MKHSKKILAIVLVFVAVFTVTVLADGEDPVISLSYLNEIFMPKVEKKIEENASGNVFTVVTVEKGDTFLAGAGCEFILRGGEATVIASKNGGLSDTTDGVDLTQDTLVPANHLLIVPRDDGRGFVAVTDVIIMVKGTYEIK